MTWYELSARIHVSLKSGAGCPPSLWPQQTLSLLFLPLRLSLLSVVCITAGDISGLHSQFGPYDQTGS